MTKPTRLKVGRRWPPVIAYQWNIPSEDITAVKGRAEVILTVTDVKKPAVGTLQFPLLSKRSRADRRQNPIPIHTRTLPAQQAEAIIGVSALNRMLDAGRPVPVRTA
ncbi:hypothetical protein [Azospirillum brasilense]|uniref:Uncharacterized protein n=3 Tax=Azospirillum TaxID=191 RepID=A0ABU4NY57_AZOBR|nr:hypothetical protein [Azospirillum brasilense]MDW7556688.1 hypothetical protein [Azospirillum brasilense]MDW7596983.1 hypothetical protein [Azospirillum brasilense]MDW7631362.1 hypothetical protein [Azospirillum brasilense]MDX5949836.1 hypothetical protein [Azospirillum brasilense]